MCFFWIIPLRERKWVLFRKISLNVSVFVRCCFLRRITLNLNRKRAANVLLLSKKTNLHLLIGQISPFPHKVWVLLWLVVGRKWRLNMESFRSILWVQSERVHLVSHSILFWRCQSTRNLLCFKIQIMESRLY
jgi:hypothetical protein